MIKAETIPYVTDQNPAGRAREFIWLNGQAWTVPQEMDKELVRLEVFGDELDNERVKGLGGGTPMYQGEGDEKKLVLRSFAGEDARYFSRQMRVFYP